MHPSSGNIEVRVRYSGRDKETNMNRVSYFEFSALDMERAKTFWEKTFDWKFEKYEGMDYYAVKTGSDEDGIDGGLSRRQKDNQVVNNIEVVDLDATIATIVQNGGKILVGKTEI